MRKTIAVGNSKFLTPTFIGVGAPKCATTWISQVLRGHPDVFVSNPKELRFFVGKNWQSKDVRWYLKFFEKSSKYKVAGEFTTNYLVEPASAERIYGLLGNIKIIVSIRNPVDRFFSHFKQKIRQGSLPQREYQVLDLNAYHQATKARPNLLKCGKYSQGIQRYFNAFGKENVLILVQEDIKHNAQVEFGRLCDFLQVEQLFNQNILNRTVLKGTMPKYRTLDRSARKISKTLDKHSPQLVNYLRQVGLFSYIRQKNARSRPDIAVDDSVRKEIAMYYQADVGMLEEMFDRRLNWNLE